MNLLYVDDVYIVFMFYVYVTCYWHPFCCTLYIYLLLLFNFLKCECVFFMKEPVILELCVWLI